MFPLTTLLVPIFLYGPLEQHNVSSPDCEDAVVDEFMALLINQDRRTFSGFRLDRVSHSVNRLIVSRSKCYSKINLDQSCFLSPWQQCLRLRVALEAHSG